MDTSTPLPPAPAPALTLSARLGAELSCRLLVIEAPPLAVAALDELLGDKLTAPLCNLSLDEASQPLAVTRRRADVVLTWVSRTPTLDFLTALRREQPDLRLLTIAATPELAHRVARTVDGSVLVEDASAETVVAALLCTAEGHTVTCREGQGAIPTARRELLDLLDSCEDEDRRLLKLLTTDATYAEMAAAQAVSTRTLKRRVAQLQRRLGVGSRTGLAAVAGNVGLFPSTVNGAPKARARVPEF